jgi:heat shock protein HslJ
VEVQVLMSNVAATVLVAILAVLVIVFVPSPPQLGLTGATWQWTGSTTRAGGTPLVVPNPEAYTIRFAPDRTFEAVADCNRVSGTYSVVPPGRMAGGTTSLSLVPAPASLVPCGAESLADQFLEQLGSVSHYLIQGSQLTITLAPPGTMTFEAELPLASPSPGA